MNIFGFYRPVNHGISLVDFLQENIQRLCRDLIPSHPPNIIVMRSVQDELVPDEAKSGVTPIVYSLSTPLKVTFGDGQSQVLENTFVGLKTVST